MDEVHLTLEMVAEFSRGKLIYLLLFMWVVKSDIWDNFLSLMNYDVWGFISEKFKVSPKKKFNLFFYSLIMIAFLLDYYFIESTFLFFSYTLIFGIAVMLNDRKFCGIREITLWEFLLGIFTIISSFTIVTPIKWHFVPKTRVFGVFNGGVFIIGYFLLFYGIKKYKTVLPFYLFYGSIVTLNGTWSFILNDFAESYISPISSHLAYSFLMWLGYPVTISGTTITVVSQSGQNVSATVAGACSGIEGMIFSIIMIVALFMGTKVKYTWRTILSIIGAICMFILNILRITLIFIVAYYYGQEGLDISHHWLGNMTFLIFILTYWFIIEKTIINKRGDRDDTPKTN